MSSRSQIILELLNLFAFAYDIDNYGKIIRLVANFKGGGLNKLLGENEKNVDKSSHSGIALGAHTEAPYHTATKVKDNHSPSPSALILMALWNPKAEPTSVVSVETILKRMTFDEVLALTTENFDFTRSETFTNGMGCGGSKVSIIELDSNGKFQEKYNSYRFTVNEHAPNFIRKSFEKFERFVSEIPPQRVFLDSTKVLVINNIKALHFQDVVQNNRRLLIRLFGYWNNTECLKVSTDPVLVKG